MKFDNVLEWLQIQRRNPRANEWYISDETGWSIAHYWAASCHVLPVNFEHWGLSDNNGQTVAHVSATAKCLPAGFKYWHMADNNGDTVAHYAVRAGFTDTDCFGRPILIMRNKDGVSVWDEFKAHTNTRIAALKKLIHG